MKMKLKYFKYLKLLYTIGININIGKNEKNMKQYFIIYVINISKICKQY